MEDAAREWLKEVLQSPRRITDVLKLWDAPLNRQGYEGNESALIERHKVLFLARHQLGVEAHTGQDGQQWWRLAAPALSTSPDPEVEKWKDWKQAPLLIQSEVLGAEVWVVKDQAAARTVEGDGRPIYFPEEFAVLQTKTPDEIRGIHRIKLAFPGCHVVG